MALPIKIAAAILSDERGRKAVGWAAVCVLAPLILVLAFICSLGAGTAQHNNQMLDHLFYGTELAMTVPPEFAQQLNDLQEKFREIDAEVSSINSQISDGSLDVVQIKAAYFVLGSESHASADSFVGCFYHEEIRIRTVTGTDAQGKPTQRQEEYTVLVPNALNASYQAIGALLGRSITEEEKEAVQDIYFHIMGSGGEGYDGAFIPGGNVSIELEVSALADPNTKNAQDLVAYATNAWESGWGYVWGTYGEVLTESMFDYKLRQYPEGVGKYAAFIRSHWIGRRTTDCVGLIKGYGWLDPETMTIQYGSHGMLDLGANGMCQTAQVKGPMTTMPDTPGLAVWMPGHIGVYIGGGEVIEAAGTKKGVVKTKLAGRGWQQWLEVPGLKYEKG